MMAAELILKLTGAYGVAGALIAGSFVFSGIDAIDAGAERSYAFRILLVPGLILLWPLALGIWLRRAAAARAR